LASFLLHLTRTTILIHMKGSTMSLTPQTRIPTPGTDLRHLAVELVVCDASGQPQKQHLWGLLRLLRRAPA
jgi:hypothetical protein